MGKIIKLNERDLTKIISKILSEQPYARQEYNKATDYLNRFPGSKPNINPKNLKKGDGGKKNPEQVKDVITLQQKLIDLGLLVTKTGKPTGYFGDLTQKGLDTYKGVKQTPEKKKEVTQLSERQKNINNAYCNSEGGIVILPNSKTSGIKWTDWAKKFNVTQQEIEIAKKSCTKEKKDYKLTPRIDRELEYIKMRGLDKQPFFIYDPKQNLLYLFNKESVLVDYTQVVDGADVQSDKSPALTVEKWCELSGLKSKPHLCTDDKTNTRKQPYYSVLANTANRFLPKGIYSITSLSRHEGYVGGGKNVFSMKDEKGNEIAAAIHGIPNLPERLRASAELETILKKDIASGKVPKEYLKSIKTIANANQSFGCVGVPAKFIDNPKVKDLAANARVFVMGESGDYLVQNATEYFEKLGSDGQNCMNPASLANKMSNVA